MMVTIQQAWDILKRINLLTSSEKISIYNAVGRIVLRNIKADNDSPPFDQSRFDGFAVGEPDQEHSYHIIRPKSPVTAGDGGHYALEKGEAIPIMTGAPLPKGTYIIVPQEKCHIDGNRLILKDIPTKERMILEKGSDFKRGETYLKKGEKINPVHVAFMALDGKSEVEVFKHPKICVLSLGNELLPVTTKKLKGPMIRNSHPALIQSLLLPYGHIQDGGSALDNLDEIKKALLMRLHSKYQIVITTGGMGQGVKDLTSRAIHEIGATSLFEGLKATPIGTFSCYQYKGEIIFSLPGGMVGVLLLTKLFIYPFIKKIQGIRVPEKAGPFKKATLVNMGKGFQATHHEGKRAARFIKAQFWKERGKLWVTPSQAKSLLEMNAFILLENEKEGGDEVSIFPLWYE